MPKYLKVWHPKYLEEKSLQREARAARFDDCIPKYVAMKPGGSVQPHDSLLRCTGNLLDECPASMCHCSVLSAPCGHGTTYLWMGILSQNNALAALVGRNRCFLLMRQEASTDRYGSRFCSYRLTVVTSKKACDQDNCEVGSSLEKMLRTIQ